MKSWNINPSSGDYVMDSGAPEETDSLQVPAYFRLKIQRKAWLYAPNANYGSDLGKLKKRHSGSDANIVESTVLIALKPLIEDKRASKITATATVQSRNSAGLEVDIIDASGNPSKLELSRIY